jgi:hypothetical protein
MDDPDCQSLPPGTIACTLNISPTSGTVPFVAAFDVTLTNVYTGQLRRLAGRIDAHLASGTSFSNWRSGYTNIAAGGTYVTSWNQSIPASGAVIGDNIFTLLAVDVTPSPYNQPPYPPSGDSASAAATLRALAP